MSALVPVRRVSVEVLAEQCGVHPELVRRLVRLGLLEPQSTSGGQWWFSSAAVARLARIQRLHGELSLNYAAIGVVLDLLERIDQLEGALRQATPTSRRGG